MAEIYDPRQVSVICKRLDNDESYTLTGFKSETEITTEKIGEPRHKINSRVYEGGGSFSVNPTNDLKVTFTMEALHRDNIYLSNLANGSIQFMFSIKASYASITDGISIPFSMVEEMPMNKFPMGGNLEGKDHEWSVIGMNASTGYHGV